MTFLRVLVLTLLAFTALTLGAADVQISHGWCSPNIANVTGSVTVNCIGVDPRALAKLNRELNSKNLQLDAKIREANLWAERYKQLEQQLTVDSSDRVLSHKAEEYLHRGELDKAGAILDRILAGEEKDIDRIAANQFSRALIFELQFQPLEALPHLELAYRYRPDNLTYGQAYALELFDHHDYTEAEAILARDLLLEKKDPQTHQVEMARTLRTLALVNTSLQQMGEAETHYYDALTIFRSLAKTDPHTFQEDLAGTLLDLGALYMWTQRTDDGLRCNTEALAIFQELAKRDPSDEPLVAATLNNSAILYDRSNRKKEAEENFQLALAMRRQLAKGNPDAYEGDLARTLLGLGTLYTQMGNNSEAEADLKESLDIRRQLARKDPGAYQPLVAITLNDLGILYSNMGRLHESEASYGEALKLNREFAEVNSIAYEPQIADQLINLGLLYSRAGLFEKAEKDIQESLTIRRRLAEGNPAVYRQSVAAALLALGSLYGQIKRVPEARSALQEALGIYDSLAIDNPTDYQAYVGMTQNMLEKLPPSAGRIQ